MQAGPLFLDATAVARLVPHIDMRGALREMFRSLAGGQAVQPPQLLSLFPGQAGDFISYLGVLAGERVFGVKLSPFIAAPGGAFVTAWTLLMSMETGQPLLLCDAKQLTTERTAGTTALAVDLLAPAGASVLCVVGSGPVAQAHVRHALALRPWRAIRVHSPRIARLSPEAVAAWVAIDPRISLHTELPPAIADAEVVMLCTSSASPVVEVDALAPGCLVTSISTNAPHAHELSPAALATMNVYCDHAATTPASAGEMRLAAELHGWSADALCGDLAGLVAGSAKPPLVGRRSFFRSIGLGLEDVVAASRLLRAHGDKAAS